jgi:hypothetical protein
MTVVLAAALGLVITGCSSSARPAESSARPAESSARPAESSASLQHLQGNDSLVPARGVYLGAYVQPAAYTQQGQIAAVQTFENQLGHPIKIVHVFHQWGKPIPGAADAYFAGHGKILLLTWSGSPDTEAIIAGRDDAMIRAAALAIKALGHPVMLEFRHEMDRPNLQATVHGPADFIKAWDHIRAIFTAVSASNVSWVWCPTGLGFADGRAQPFYPGNREVDWVCADVYATSVQQSLSQAAAPFLAWADRHDKPVIIGEFGVYGGNEAARPAWLAAAGRLPESDHQIKAMAYWDASGVDSTDHSFQMRLGNQPAALTAFARLLAEPLYSPSAHGS